MEDAIFIINTLYTFEDKNKDEVFLCTANHGSVREFMRLSVNGNNVIEKGNLLRIEVADGLFKNYEIDYLKVYLHPASLLTDNGVSYSTEVYVSLKEVL